jgi:hypothetical protein
MRQANLTTVIWHSATVGHTSTVAAVAHPQSMVAVATAHQVCALIPHGSADQEVVVQAVEV